MAPVLPDDADPRLLDRATRAGLRSLPETLADTVAGHLVAAGRSLDTDPALALEHARYARELAPRLAVVREALGLTAYACGDYATALSELRAVRRMTGDPSYLAVMADCERGLGRPQRALELAADPQVARMAPAERAELLIVASGARRDLGDTAAAVVMLRSAAESAAAVAPWTARLWYAYAVALESAGRRADARRWFTAASSIDDDGELDADDRLEALGED